MDKKTENLLYNVGKSLLVENGGDVDWFQAASGALPTDPKTSPLEQHVIPDAKAALGRAGDALGTVGRDTSAAIGRFADGLRGGLKSRVDAINNLAPLVLREPDSSVNVYPTYDDPRTPEERAANDAKWDQRLKDARDGFQSFTDRMFGNGEAIRNYFRDKADGVQKWWDDQTEGFKAAGKASEDLNKQMANIDLSQAYGGSGGYDPSTSYLQQHVAPAAQEALGRAGDAISTFGRNTVDGVRKWWSGLESDWAKEGQRNPQQKSPDVDWFQAASGALPVDSKTSPLEQHVIPGAKAALGRASDAISTFGRDTVDGVRKWWDDQTEGFKAAGKASEKLNDQIANLNLPQGYGGDDTSDSSTSPLTRNIGNWFKKMTLDWKVPQSQYPTKPDGVDLGVGLGLTPSPDSPDTSRLERDAVPAVKNAARNVVDSIGRGVDVVKNLVRSKPEESPKEPTETPQETPSNWWKFAAGAGIPVALAGGYGAYRKLKNKK